MKGKGGSHVLGVEAAGRVWIGHDPGCVERLDSACEPDAAWPALCQGNG
jgi:hypothetical protein